MANYITRKLVGFHFEYLSFDENFDKVEASMFIPGKNETAARRKFERLTAGDGCKVRSVTFVEEARKIEVNDFYTMSVPATDAEMGAEDGFDDDESDIDENAESGVEGRAGPSEDDLEPVELGAEDFE